MEKVKAQVGYNGTLEELLVHVKMIRKQCHIKLQKRFWMDFRDSDEDYPEAKTMFNVTPKTPFEIRQTEKFREATASAEYMQELLTEKGEDFYIPIPDPRKFNVTSGMESLFCTKLSRDIIIRFRCSKRIQSCLNLCVLVG